MLKHGNPAIIGVFRVGCVALVQSRKFDLFEFFLLRVKRCASIGGYHKNRANRRLAVAQHLKVGERLNCRGSLIDDFETDINDIAAAMKSINLGHTHTVGLGCVKPHLDFILARSQIIGARIRCLTCLVAG
jgi:hypothetical protein